MFIASSIICNFSRPTNLFWYFSIIQKAIYMEDLFEKDTVIQSKFEFDGVLKLLACATPVEQQSSNAWKMKGLCGLVCYS
jgi:hypothetical protein